ncbi:hypothetical protein [Herbaspirillum sp. alder98]|uniref:hypothetical protein n=1 Tax=Herbaspirillum sp. alder98 TaxID=2913096 RepID=UPI001CD8FD4B|nr:hypothetical protein [Herbaspirillum sp. alder98]MCA1326846.1 hypothetical protein [Herbaspirillum sp. alder98]
MAILTVVDRATLDPEGQQAYDEEIARVGRVTNMKGTILRSLPAHRAYHGSYLIKAELIKLLGKRAFNVYANAISSASDCILCYTFFRQALKADGIDPKDFVATETEQLLAELGSAIGGNRAHQLDADLWRRLRDTFDDTAIVNLIGFGGTMVATNIFNSVLEVDIDDYLQEQ